MLKYNTNCTVVLLMLPLKFHNFRSIMADANLDALLFELDIYFAALFVLLLGVWGSELI